MNTTDIVVLTHEIISSKIKENSIIQPFKKDKYGEVFTPEALIYKMLGYFPEHVWTNPYFKWLDPTAGIGNFMMIVYLKLMEGLSNWEPNKLTRSKHIIENMLFMIEIDSENTEICKNFFGTNSNILREDFLKSSVFDLQFDVIVGNPPFQKNVIGKKRTGSKNKLYERILSKCTSILNAGGYLSFITPDNLFSGSSNTYIELLQTNILAIHFEKNIQKYFPKIQQFMCFFLIQKTDKTNALLEQNVKNTCIIDNTGNLFKCALTARPINPVRLWTEKTEQLIQKYISNNKNNGVYNRGLRLNMYDLSDIENDTIYELIYKPDKKLSVNNKNNAVGLGQKKIVIFLISTQLEFECDFNGIYGVGPNTFYFPIQNNEEGIILSRFFKSEIYKLLILSTKTNRQFIKLACLQYLNIQQIIMNGY